MTATPENPPEEAKSAEKSDSAPPVLDGALSVSGPIEAALERVLVRQKIPESQRRTLLQTATREVIIAVQKSESFKGPLPHPSHFAGYEAALSGSADRIVSMAEKEQEHRHDWEKREINGQLILAIIGVVFGFLIVLSFLFGAIYLAIEGQPYVASLMIASSMASMAVSFVKGRDLYNGASKSTTSPPPPSAARATGKRQASKNKK